MKRFRKSFTRPSEVQRLWAIVAFTKTSCCHHLSNKISIERLSRFLSVSTRSWVAPTSYASSLWFIQTHQVLLTSRKWSRVSLHHKQWLRNCCLKNVLEFKATNSCLPSTKSSQVWHLFSRGFSPILCQHHLLAFLLKKNGFFLKPESSSGMYVNSYRQELPKSMEEWTDTQKMG